MECCLTPNEPQKSEATCEHHRKLRGASRFCHPCHADVLGPEESFTFVPSASHDYLLPTPSPSLRLLKERPKTPCLGLLLRRGDRTKGTMNA
jgi:hypothetical protein